MKGIKLIVLISILSLFASFVTVGCEKEGPMEKAGKKMDEAVDSAKKTIDE